MIDYGKWAFSNKKLVYYFVAVLLFGGLYSVYDMSKLEDPEITVKTAMIVAVYPGASAHEIELEVTDLLEREIRTIADVDNVSSYSYRDMAILQVEMNSTVSDDKIEQCWDILRHKVNDIKPSLPLETIITVKDDFGLVYGMFYALTGEGLSREQLGDYARLIQRELADIEGVAGTVVYGEQKECVNIELFPEQMAFTGITPAEIIATINGQLTTNYTGYYNNGDNRIALSVSDRFKTIEEIGAMIIQGYEDEHLRLSDIANIKDGYVKPMRSYMTHNGKEALGIAVSASSGTDIIKVGKRVEEKLARLKMDKFPVGVEYEQIFFQPDRVKEALGAFLINLLESVLIVVVILVITMGIRSGFIIGISLVIIVIGTFLILGIFNGSMQRVSLASFVFAMGMLVDNAIVIVDGILVDIKSGKPRFEAMTAIGRKTATPLLGATLIAILAFLPIFLSPDTAGVYVKDLFIVLAVSLLLSWILALIHVPLMADKWFKKTTDNEVIHKGKIYDYFRLWLSVALRNRYFFIVVVIILIFASSVCYRFMSRTFFPDMVYDQVYMEYKLPEGTEPNKVLKQLGEIENYLKTRSEIVDITATIGGTPVRYNLVRSMTPPSLSYGELIIDFTSPESLEENINEIQQELLKRYPHAYINLKRYNIMYKRYPIEAQFTGADPMILNKLADTTRYIMEHTPEVRLVTTDWEASRPVMDFEYEQMSARRARITRQALSASLLYSSEGFPVGVLRDGTRTKKLYMKCVDSLGRQMENLENISAFSILPNFIGITDKELLVKIKNGTINRNDIVEKIYHTIPVRQIINGIDIKWEATVIPRYNGKRAQTVMCSPAPGIDTERARSIVARKIDKLQLPVGYELKWKGEKEASERTMYYLFKNIPIGIILILAILIFLFKDYRKPLIIVCCIPLLAVGIVGTMIISGKSFNFCAIVGALGLIGMMTKNCIILIDEIERLIMEKRNLPYDALIESSVNRMRPVIMASLTTILGMIPLLRDAMFGSMAATIMGGLLFSTFATLFYVPVLYAIFFGVKIKR